MRVGLLFQSPADNHVDVVMVVAASLLSWAQVRVPSPRPLGPADLVRAERQQTRPWPQADVDVILGSRLLVHNGGLPPLSGAVLGNTITSTVGAPQLELTIQLLTEMQKAWEPAGQTPGTTSPSVLSRAQWVEAFRAAADRCSPSIHECGERLCEFCEKIHPGDTATDWLRFESMYFCSEQCQHSHARKERVERAAEFP